MKHFSFKTLVGAIGCLTLLAACSTSPTESRAELAKRLAEPVPEEIKATHDGPYAFYNEDHTKMDVYWICDEEITHIEQPVSKPIPVVCGYKKPIQAKVPPQISKQDRYTAPKFAALSDVHGQFEIFIQVLQRNGIINETWDWNYGDGHLIIVGDIFDRGPQQTEAFWFIYQLEQQAEKQGGKVHQLLGNHETMILYDDLRYLNKKYHKVTEQMDKETYPDLYAENSVLGAWLRTRPVMITVNDVIFMHGGLHPEILSLNLNMGEINDAFRNSLGMPRPEIKADPVLKLLYGSKGPIWYRGYFREKYATNHDMLDTLFESFEVNRIVVGHTSFDGVFQHWDERVYSVDSSMKLGKSGEILFWEDGKFSRGTFWGERGEVPLKTGEER